MELLLIFIFSLVISLLATPLTIKLAHKYGLVDNPHLRPHPAHVQNRIIPRAGGLPIYLSIILGILLFFPLQKYLLGIILGLTVLLIMGLIDDKKREFNPYIRLGLLFLAAGCAVGAGIGISFVNNPFAHLPFLVPTLQGSIIRLDEIVYTINFFGPHSLILIADILALIWIVSLTQIINWSKGVDGQMPSVTLVAALTLGFLSLKFYSQGDLGQLNTAKLAFLLAGASLGALIFNWHPSKIIPGFTGSTIAAFMLAVLAILSSAKLATALLVLAIPTVDFGYTIIRRVAAGHSPVWGDRGHLHHRLLDLGWSHQKISLFYLLGSGILGVTALLVDTGSKVFAVVLVTIIFTIFILWLNSFQDRQ